MNDFTQIEKTIIAIISKELDISFKTHLPQAIEKGVIKALLAFGADAYNPNELQKDFIFLRTQRTQNTEINHHFKKSVLTVALGAGAIAIWEGLKLLSH